MVRHKPWQFFIIRFTADDGKHTVSVGTSDPIEVVDFIMDAYSNVRTLRVTQRVEEL